MGKEETLKTNTRKVGLTHNDLAALALDPVERILAEKAPDAVIEHISHFPTREERQFAFHCFWVPSAVMGLCEEAFRSPEGRVLRVGQFALFIAHSRMLTEMIAWGQDPRFAWWYPHSVATACRWWMQRYDSHLRAIDWSNRYWVKRKCPDCCHEQRELACASRLGFMQHADSVGWGPTVLGKLIAEMKKREQCGSRESEFFHKYAKGVSEPRWDYPDLDLWLIEVWPIVEDYDWTYREIYDLAGAKFGEDDSLESAAVLSRVETLKERCEFLGLRLSPEARARRGRPQRIKGDGMPIDTFGERVYGQVAKLGESPYQNVRLRAPAAYQMLAEMAVNIEPFTRLLNHTTKELFTLAVPRMKRGDKKFPLGLPFFQ